MSHFDQIDRGTFFIPLLSLFGRGLKIFLVENGVKVNYWRSVTFNLKFGSQTMPYVKRKLRGNSDG